MGHRPIVSTATRFKFAETFPFCVQTQDLAFGDLGPSTFIIKDLTEAEIFDLFWNLETIDIGFELSALFVGASGTHATDFTFTTPAGIAPRERACVDTYSLAGNTPITNGVTFTVGAGDDWFQEWRFNLIPLATPSNNAVVKQTDGNYQFIFEYPNGLDDSLAGGGGIHIAAKPVTGGGGAYVDTGLSQTIGFLSGGSVRFNFIVSNAAYTYVGSPSFPRATLSPSFYTY